MAGAGELGTQLIAEITKTARERQIDGATQVMELVRQTAKQRYGEWFPISRPPFFLEWRQLLGRI